MDECWLGQRIDGLQRGDGAVSGGTIAADQVDLRRRGVARQGESCREGDARCAANCKVLVTHPSSCKLARDHGKHSTIARLKTAARRELYEKLILVLKNSTYQILQRDPRTGILEPHYGLEQPGWSPWLCIGSYVERLPGKNQVNEMFRLKGHLRCNI